MPPGAPADNRSYARRVAENPPALGPLGSVPPALRYRLAEAVKTGELARVMEEGEPWFPAEPGLAELGYWMIQSRQPVEIRRRGCMWLTMFPTVETVKRLAALATNGSTPAPIREQAIWSLGYRQQRALHPKTHWPAEAVQLADEALYKLADAATTYGTIASDQLPQALRHVQADFVAAVFARAPGLWGAALESFATVPLARVLFVSIDDIPPQHRVRVLRLIAATLGPEAVPLLVARARAAAPEQRIEMLLLAVALGGEKHLPRLEDALRSGAPPGADGRHGVGDRVRERAKWHLANPGVVPTVRGLRVARTTAVIAPANRALRCAEAADDLATLPRFARYTESYVYTLWSWMVRGANDPARATTLVSAYPDAQKLVGDLYIQDLARRGKVAQTSSAAHANGLIAKGALQLAIWGRPLAALALASTERIQSAELGCARALACYRAGRPDLTERLLAEDLPPPEIAGDQPSAYPGSNEQWLIEHAHDPVHGALASGLTAVLALAKGAPHDADPDLTSLDPIAAVEQRLSRGLAGSTVYLAGEFKSVNRDKIAAALERAGARLVAGPCPGTDYYVHGDNCLAQTIAQLEHQGARRIRRGELEGIE